MHLFPIRKKVIALILSFLLLNTNLFAQLFLEGAGGGSGFISYACGVTDSSGWTTICTTADQTLSLQGDPTLNPDAELHVALSSGHSYEIEVRLIYATPAATNVDMLVMVADGTSTIRGSIGCFCLDISDAGTAQATAVSTNSSLPIGAVQTKRLVILPGTFTSSSGSLKVYWSQANSSANSLIVYTGSQLRYHTVD